MSTNTEESHGSIDTELSRRSLLRRGAAATGAVATGGATTRYAVQPTAAIPWVPAALIAGSMIMNARRGDDPDTEAIQGAIQFEDHLESYNRFREWWEVEEEYQLASFRNDVQNYHRQALNVGIRRLYESGLEGETESSGVTKAKEAMDADADELAEWIVTHWNARLGSQAATKAGDLDALRLKGSESSSFAGHNYMFLESALSYELPSGTGTVPVSLWTAEQAGEEGIGFVNPSGEIVEERSRPTVQVDGSPHISELVDELWVSEPDPDNYSFDAEEYDGPEDFDSWEHVDGDQQGLNADSYRNLLQDIEEKLATAKSDLDAVASGHYTEIQNRDIELSELMGPSGLMDTASNADTAHEAALFFRASEMPQATEGVEIEMDHPDQDETIVLEGILGWSVAETGDSIPVGEPISPSNLLGRIYFATEYEDENGELTGEVVQLRETFTIVGTETGSTSVEFETNSLPDADTDPSEAIRIMSEGRDSEQDARDLTIDITESDDDGGGPGGSTLALAAAAVVAIAAALSQTLGRGEN